METKKKLNEEQQSTELSGEKLEQAAGGFVTGCAGTSRTPAEKFGTKIPGKQESALSAETCFI